MSRPIQIFLGRCLATYPIDADGQPNQNGVSNHDIGQWFHDEINNIGGPRVRVVTTENPTTRRISDVVKRSIEESDASICLFPKRVRCPHHGWTTSQYVTSESGYAASRFRHETEKRLFAFVEEGVNRDWLGLAFPGDRTVYTFRRDDLPACRSFLEAVVNDIIKDNPSPSNKPEPLLLRKVVRVRRDGRVIVENTFRFRIQKDTNRFQMRHSLWRVRDLLPNFAQMRETVPGDNRDYFVCLPTQFGASKSTTIEMKLDKLQPARHGKETDFRVEMRSNPLQAGDIVEYQFEYSYADAFFDTSDLEPWELNSTGLRTGGRGAVREAVLIVSFERNWNKSAHFPAIELDGELTGPVIATADETNFPSSTDPRDFWHRDKDEWHPAGCMELCQDNPSPRWESYVWRRPNFSGLVKATWQPSFNYHQPRGNKKDRDRSSHDGSGEARA